jgi:hypothetical protein
VRRVRVDLRQPSVLDGGDDPAARDAHGAIGMKILSSDGKVLLRLEVEANQSRTPHHGYPQVMKKQDFTTKVAKSSRVKYYHA